MDRIRVTRADIENGAANDECNCPIALALKRAFATRNVVVGSGGIAVGGKIYDTPVAVVEFINKFDDGMNVEPFSFCLEMENAR